MRNPRGGLILADKQRGGVQIINPRWLRSVEPINAVSEPVRYADTAAGTRIKYAELHVDLAVPFVRFIAALSEIGCTVVDLRTPAKPST